MTACIQHPSSFRDPSGFVYHRDGVLLRQINPSYQTDYEYFINSGLYEKLSDRRHLIGHDRVDHALAATPDAFVIIKPEKVPFISYPYEWSFSQLKAAALLTLHIQKTAIEHGMSLKDASSYNIQFIDNQPIFIDTLSFEKTRENQPWKAYRQFCQHFLSPLALMAYKDPRLVHLLKSNMDGIPLDLASHLLPFKTKMFLGLGFHIHWHARVQKRHASSHEKVDPSQKFSKQSLLSFIAFLNKTVENLNLKINKSEWKDYYSENNNYSSDAIKHKESIVLQMLESIQPKIVWDIGANTGKFSMLASKVAERVIAFDADPVCVEIHSQNLKSNNKKRIMPLVLDITNPSPSIGWQHEERSSLESRGPSDLVMALGLIHHLCIAHNIPLDQVIGNLKKLGKVLLIEFVPKSDSQVQKLLATREDVFNSFTEANFEEALRNQGNIVQRVIIQDTERVLYLVSFNV